jgi:hypothetical protein
LATDLYASLPELTAYMGATTDTEDEANLTISLNGASRHVDQFTGRRFWADDAPTERVFRTHGRVNRLGEGDLLIVDDIASEAGVIVEGWNGSSYDGINASSYELTPESDIDRGKPATGILFPGFPVAGYRKVRVTATWGWPSVPSEVKQATLIQAARLYQRKDSPNGVMGDANWGLVRVPFMDPDVKALLQHLRIPGFR